MPERADIFEKVFAVIEKRKGASPEESYVAGLLAKGVTKMNAKVLEEAVETCQAALGDDRDHLVHEICDLLFHVLVLAAGREVALEEIRAELDRRFGTSGLAEKASRKES